MSEPNGQTQALAPIDARQQRAIALREEISQDTQPRAIVPRTFAEAQSFAGAIAASSLVPKALAERAPDVLMIVLAGAELGIPPIKAIGLYHVIEGVPKLSADGLAAVVMASPLCEYLEPREQSDTRVVWAAKKRGRPEVTLAVTQEDIVRAGLDKPRASGAQSNHVKFPRQMKNARAKAELARMVFPEIVAGLITSEEAQDLATLAETNAAPAFSAPAPSGVRKLTEETKASGKAQTSKAAPKPIDVQTQSQPSATPSTTSASTGASTTSAPASQASAQERPAGNGTDQATADAFAKARKDAEELAEQKRRDAEQAPPAPANGNDTTTQSTPEDSFGEDEPVVPARTIEAFESEVARAVQAKDLAKLQAVKADWMPWSKVDGDGGGRQYAHRMRDVFTKAQADLGAR